MRALVCGFEAFGGASFNTSLTAVRRLPPRIGTVEIRTLELPTSFARAPAKLAAAIERLAPDLVLCVGEAGDRAVLSIERLAVNLCDARIADNDGVQPRESPALPGGPAAYFATLPVATIAAALQSAGLPVEVSSSAGSFVCNHVFYSLMHLAASRNWHGGFMHVPHSALPLDDIVRGIGIAIEAAAAVNPASD